MFECRLVVKGRHSRDDTAAGLGKLEHVFEMDRRKWRFAGHNQKRSALLEHHIGAPFDQIAGNSTGDAGQPPPA